MSDRIITAEALITAKDGTGDVFARIASKINGVGKSAKASVEIERMAKSLEQAQSQMRAIDKLQSSRTAFADVRAKFNAQKVAVEQAARALREAEQPTKQMQASYQRLQADVSKASTAFEKQKSALLDAKHAAEGFGTPLGKIASEQARLRGVIDSTTKAIEHQALADHKAAAAHALAEKAAEKRAHGIAHHGFGNFALGAAAGAVGVHSILGVGEKVWEAGAERQHVITGMQTAGMPREEIGRAQQLAMDVSKDAPNMSVSQIMELHKEARSAVQHPEEVFELMPDLARAASVLKGMGAENANIADLVKGGESLGLMNDPKRFHAFLEGQVKAMQVMGKTITTEQIYEAAKYSKSAGATLSDEFLNTTMPSLIQEMHGSSAGDALSALTKRWRGGLAHQHIAVERLNQMGLLEDPSQIKRSKSGEIMGYMGKLKGDDLLGSNPAKFFTDIWEPAAQKMGVTTLADKIKLLNETLPSTAANLGRILIQQEETLKQHRANYEAATGLKETVEKQKADWDAATMAFKASLSDLGSSLTGGNVASASKGLSWLAGEIKDLSDVAARHPYIAASTAAVTGGAALAVAGTLSWKLATAGMSLQTAAGMLEDAAIRLGASPAGKVPFGGAVGAGAGAAEGGAVVGGALGTAAGLGTVGTIAGLAWLIEASRQAQQPGKGGAWAPATFETRDADEEALADQKSRLADLQGQVDRLQAGRKFPDQSNPVVDQLRDQVADLKNQIAARERSLALVPKFPIGPTSDGNAPSILGYETPQRTRQGLSFSSVPLMSVGGNSLLDAPMPNFGPLPAFVDPNREEYGPYIPGKLGHEMFGPTMPAPPLDIRPPAQRNAPLDPSPNRPYNPGPIDVTGKVQSEVSVKADSTVRVEITAAPGIETRQTFQGTNTRVSTGPSVPNAGRPAGIGHM